ncbi:iron-containing alcohol dehydrogenase [Sphingomonas ginsenosidivorax]|uniref:Iron-containing alcohol dehydrogenase n=1 Tax=Sphingomonas ginsenosidivorax TaxID=862135 RepID=A0A5C6UE47_9SPHN|nr:iron-containing alcohol dehydrogenase family protein [Sphingomonas ginsenosidivorax]TXC71077.1 iron-containing alcohol dehydrogenase [Sphingomonas ginsenosidivorax]
MSRSFRHFDPGSRILYGEDCLGQLSAELRRVGAKRAVVFCGNTIARSEPGLETVRAALGEFCVGAFTGVAEQSPLPSVEAAARLLAERDADAVVAIGGGSAVVTARAASILYGEGGDIRDLCTVFTPGAAPKSPRLANPKLPQFVIPTTPTTAFAKSGAAVTVEDGRRLALFDPKARVQALFVHPAFLRATPWRLTLDAALDAFAQGVQGLESARREPLADALLIHGVRLIRQSLDDARDGDSDAARRDLVLAAQLIGQGTDFVGAGMASAIGHAIGARCAVGNGHAKAVVLPHTLVFNSAATQGRLAELANALEPGSGGDANALAGTCTAFFASLDVPSRLRDLGVPEEALPLIAADAAQDWFITQNPRAVSAADVVALLQVVW